MTVHHYVAEVTWDSSARDLPPLVGPFGTEEEADTWVRLNVPNGIAVVREVHYPYLRTGHYPVPVKVIEMDTDDDMVVLPGTTRTVTVQRCGCTDSLEHDYGTGDHVMP